MYLITGKKLRKKLESGTPDQLELLQNQIDTDPETHRMLTPLIRDVPQYRGIAPASYVDHHSLLDVLKFLVLFEKRGSLFFSKVGNKFIGFMVYVDDGKVIKDIKMATFFDDEKKSNIVLASDLIKFIDWYISKRDKIEWEVCINNEDAINQYERLLNQRKYVWSKVKDQSGIMWVYTVAGIEPLHPDGWMKEDPSIPLQEMAQSAKEVEHRLTRYDGTIFTHLLKLFYFREFTDYFHNWTTAVFKSAYQVQKLSSPPRLKNKYPTAEMIYDWMWGCREDAFNDHHEGFLEDANYKANPEYMHLPYIHAGGDVVGASVFMKDYHLWLAKELSKKGKISLTDVQGEIRELHKNIKQGAGGFYDHF